jgi:ribose transport system substrate-binding protein
LKSLVALLLLTQSINSWATPKTFKIAALYWSSNIEGQVAMRIGLENHFENVNKLKGKYRYQIQSFVAGDGVDGIRNQLKQFSQVLANKKKVDLIIVQPTDNAALASKLIEANKLKIPVVAYDQYIVDGELASFVTSNNYQAGVLNAEYVDSKFDNTYPVQIVLVEYQKVSSAIDRVDGFFDTLKKRKQRYQVIETYSAVEPTSGLKAAESMLKKFPKKNSIDVVFSINDGAGVSIAKELIKKGRKEVIQVSVDGDPESVGLIKNDKVMQFNSAQFCASIGQEAAKVGRQILEGKRYPKKVLVPTFPISKSTLNKYPGWRGDIPKEKIKKAWINGFWNSNVEYHY